LLGERSPGLSEPALVLLDGVLDRAQPAHPGRRPAERAYSRVGVGPEVPQALPERLGAPPARLEVGLDLLALAALLGRLGPRRALAHDLPQRPGIHVCEGTVRPDVGDRGTG